VIVTGGKGRRKRGTRKKKGGKKIKWKLDCHAKGGGSGGPNQGR